MNRDERWMRRAIALARRYEGRTAPNPMVGAVVVKEDRLVGEGAHAGPGSPHAEIVALNQAGERARDATLYVTLEPCNHTGRTPPCTKAIVAAGIRRVVVGTRDPNPHVLGKGCERLRAEGIAVDTGVLASEAELLIADFRVWVTKNRPFFIYKVAATWDGATASQGFTQERITGEKSQRWVHSLRARVDAVMVGKNTYLRDDPDLRPRGVRGAPSPYRIVVASHVPEPRGKLTQNEPQTTWIIAGNDPEGYRTAWENHGARVSLLKLPLTPVAVSEHLWKEGIHRVLLEGGGTLAHAFLNAGLLDWLILGHGPLLCGGTPDHPLFAGEPRRPLPQGWRFCPRRIHRRGNDLWFEGPIESP